MLLKEVDNNNIKHTFITPHEVGLPHIDDLCWLSGFEWKGVYIKILPETQAKFLFEEMKALNYCFIEYIQIIENYKLKRNDEMRENNFLSNEIIFPLISYAKFNGLVLFCSNCINLYEYDLSMVQPNRSILLRNSNNLNSNANFLNSNSILNNFYFSNNNNNNNNNIPNNNHQVSNFNNLNNNNNINIVNNFELENNTNNNYNANNNSKIFNMKSPNRNITRNSSAVNITRSNIGNINNNNNKDNGNIRKSNIFAMNSNTKENNLIMHSSHVRQNSNNVHRNSKIGINPFQSVNNDLVKNFNNNNNNQQNNQINSNMNIFSPANKFNANNKNNGKMNYFSSDIINGNNNILNSESNRNKNFNQRDFNLNHLNSNNANSNVNLNTYYNATKNNFNNNEISNIENDLSICSLNISHNINLDIGLGGYDLDDFKESQIFSRINSQNFIKVIDDINDNYHANNNTNAPNNHWSPDINANNLNHILNSNNTNNNNNNNYINNPKFKFMIISAIDLIPNLFNYERNPQFIYSPASPNKPFIVFDQFSLDKLNAALHLNLNLNPEQNCNGNCSNINNIINNNISSPNKIINEITEKILALDDINKIQSYEKSALCGFNFKFFYNREFTATAAANSKSKGEEHQSDNNRLNEYFIGFANKQIFLDENFLKIFSNIKNEKLENLKSLIEFSNTKIKGQALVMYNQEGNIKLKYALINPRLVELNEKNNFKDFINILNKANNNGDYNAKSNLKNFSNLGDEYIDNVDFLKYFENFAKYLDSCQSIESIKSLKNYFHRFGINNSLELFMLPKLKNSRISDLIKINILAKCIKSHMNYHYGLDFVAKIFKLNFLNRDNQYTNTNINNNNTNNGPSSKAGKNIKTDFFDFIKEKSIYDVYKIKLRYAILAILNPHMVNKQFLNHFIENLNFHFFLKNLKWRQIDNCIGFNFFDNYSSGSSLNIINKNFNNKFYQEFDKRNITNGNFSDMKKNKYDELNNINNDLDGNSLIRNNDYNKYLQDSLLLNLIETAQNKPFLFLQAMEYHMKIIIDPLIKFKASFSKDNFTNYFSEIHIMENEPAALSFIKPREISFYLFSKCINATQSSLQYELYKDRFKATRNQSQSMLMNTQKDTKPSSGFTDKNTTTHNKDLQNKNNNLLMNFNNLDNYYAKDINKILNTPCNIKNNNHNYNINNGNENHNTKHVINFPNNYNLSNGRTNTQHIGKSTNDNNKINNANDSIQFNQQIKLVENFTQKNTLNMNNKNKNALNINDFAGNYELDREVNLEPDDDPILNNLNNNNNDFENSNYYNSNEDDGVNSNNKDNMDDDNHYTNKESHYPLAPAIGRKNLQTPIIQNMTKINNKIKINSNNITNLNLKNNVNFDAYSSNNGNISRVPSGALKKQNDLHNHSKSNTFIQGNRNWNGVTQKSQLFSEKIEEQEQQKRTLNILENLSKELDLNFPAVLYKMAYKKTSKTLGNTGKDLYLNGNRNDISEINTTNLEKTRSRINVKNNNNYPRININKYLKSHYSFNKIEVIKDWKNNSEILFNDIITNDNAESCNLYSLFILLVYHIYIDFDYNLAKELLNKIKDNLKNFYSYKFEDLACINLLEAAIVEKKNYIESEEFITKCLIFTLFLFGDPRGRNAQGSNFLLFPFWKISRQTLILENSLINENFKEMFHCQDYIFKNKIENFNLNQTSLQINDFYDNKIQYYFDEGARKKSLLNKLKLLVNDIHINNANNNKNNMSSINNSNFLAKKNSQNSANKNNKEENYFAFKNNLNLTDTVLDENKICELDEFRTFILCESNFAYFTKHKYFPFPSISDVRNSYQNYFQSENFVNFIFKNMLFMHDCDTIYDEDVLNKLSLNNYSVMSSLDLMESKSNYNNIIKKNSFNQIQNFDNALNLQYKNSTITNHSETASKKSREKANVLSPLLYDYLNDRMSIKRNLPYGVVLCWGNNTHNETSHNVRI